MASKQSNKPVFTSPFTKRNVAAQIFGMAMQYFPAPKGGMFYFTFHLNQLRDVLANCGISDEHDVEEFVTHILIGYYRWHKLLDEEKYEIRANPNYDPSDEPPLEPIDAMFMLSNAYENLPGNLSTANIVGAEIIGIAHRTLHKPADAKGTIGAISLFVNGSWPMLGSDGKLDSFIMALIGQLNGVLSTAVNNAHTDEFMNGTKRQIVEIIYHPSDKTRTELTLPELYLYRWKQLLNRYLPATFHKKLHMDVAIYTTDAKKEQADADEHRKERRDRELRAVQSDCAKVTQSSVTEAHTTCEEMTVVAANA